MPEVSAAHSAECKILKFFLPPDLPITEGNPCPQGPRQHSSQTNTDISRTARQKCRTPGQTGGHMRPTRLHTRHIQQRRRPHLSAYVPRDPRMANAPSGRPFTHRCRGPCGRHRDARTYSHAGPAEAPGARECLASLYLRADLHWLDENF